LQQQTIFGSVKKDRFVGFWKLTMEVFGLARLMECVVMMAITDFKSKEGQE
jgi:hypothetical protein